jgi:hypothetical protein
MSMEPGKDFRLFCHWSSAMHYTLAVQKTWTKDLQVPHLLVISAKMGYCIVKEWMVCYLIFLYIYFTDICSLFSLWGRKSFHLATVKLCTSCSQTADRKAGSLNQRWNSVVLGGKNSFLNWFEWTLPPHATHCLSSCLSSADAYWSA